jgi:glycosyltransferase involved in cell wall biosynthesis
MSPSVPAPESPLARVQAAGARIPVLLVESGRTYGGTEKVVSELARRMDRDRFQPWVVIPRAPALDHMAADLRAHGIPVERLDEIRSRFQPALAWRTFRFLRRHRKGVLHVHHVWPAADRYVVPLAHLAGVGSVIVTEHLVGYSHSTGQKWLKQRELARADQVVCVSRAVAAMLERDYAFDGDRGRVIENGVDAAGLDRTQPRAIAERRRVRAERGVPEDAFVWTFVGRLETQKGTDILVDAFARAHGPGATGSGARRDARLWIVGDGAQRGPLEARAREAGIADRVHFAGAVFDASPFYWGGDGFALLSRWEGLPLALLEAQAAGLPVVAAAAGGIPEAVMDGTTGLLVPKEDPLAAATALLRIEDDAALATRLGYEAARQAREEWSWERMVSAYEVLYERAWRRAGGGTP